MTRRRFPNAPPPVSVDRASGIESTRWTPAARIAFRFGIVYLGLFVLATQLSGSMIPNLVLSYRGMGRLWPMRDITHWTGGHVFGIPTALDDVSGGEPLFFWIQTCWLLIVSVIAVAIWSTIDRRQHYETLYGWFRLAVRLVLAAALFEYGMTKVIPTQFPAPPLTTLVTPVGDLTLSALLWTSVGASQPYQIFTGCVEVLAAALLLIPRATMLGALIGLAAAIQVFVLNMTYDIGLKLISLHVIVLALIVLAPDIPRLVDLVRNRPVPFSAEPRPARTRRGRLLVAWAPIVFGLYLLGMYAYINWSFWHVAGGGRPRSVLYGIWNVEQLSIDGQVRAAQLNDYDRRWRRVIFDEDGIIVFQRTDDSLARYGAAIDSGRNLLTLTKGNSRNWAATFAFEREPQDRLVIEGDMDGYRIAAQLRRVDFDAFPLLNSTFRWVRPHDAPQPAVPSLLTRP